MTETFKVGDVAIFCRPGSINYGAEVTIVGPLKRWRLWLAAHDYYVAEAHAVEGPLVGGNELFTKRAAEPRHLRKKGSPLPPNREQAGEWDECPWQPSSETVTEPNSG